MIGVEDTKMQDTMLSKGLRNNGDQIFGDGKFLHKCILQNLIVHFNRTRISYFTILHIFIMASTK